MYSKWFLLHIGVFSGEGGLIMWNDLARGVVIYQRVLDCTVKTQYK